MSSARAVEIIAQVKALLEELNRLSKALPLPERVEHDIFEYYYFGCAGGPGGAKREIIPVVPKIPVWPDRPQGNSFEFSRIGARNRGTPERMIWELYPPQSAAEHEERAQRIRAADAKERTALPEEDRILQRAAAFAAKRTGRKPEELLADASWVEEQRALQAMMKSIRIVY